MYETTINEILNTDKITRKIYLGCYAIDELTKINKFPSCLIINSEPRTKSGEHWLACYLDSHKNVYFFDSYGKEPSFYKLDKFLKNNSLKIFYNTKRIQGILPYCGLYCIFFLIFIVRNRLFDFYKLFKKNVILNDNFIHQNISQ